MAISTAYGHALWGEKSDPSALVQRQIVVRLTASLAYPRHAVGQLVSGGVGLRIQIPPKHPTLYRARPGLGSICPHKYTTTDETSVDRFVLVVDRDLPPTRSGTLRVSHSCNLHLIVEMAFEYLRNFRTRGFVACRTQLHRKHPSLLS